MIKIKIEQGSIFRSIDDGTTWTRVQTAIGVDYVGLVFSYRVVYALDVDGMVYKSIDAGITWTELGNVQYGEWQP